MKPHIYTARDLLDKLRRGNHIAEVEQAESGRKAERVVIRFQDGRPLKTKWSAVLEAERAHLAEFPLAA